MKEEKWAIYSSTIVGALSELLNEDSEYFIDLDEVEEDGGTTEFVHALLNAAPAFFSNQIFNTPSNLLASNHVANKLCFQYAGNK